MTSMNDKSGKDKDDLPFVSVIIPVFNDSDGLRNTLKSLAEQTYPADRFEVIVSDNGSSDDTVSAAHEFDDVFGDGRFTVVDGSATKGSYAARNAGVKQSSEVGILAFTDAECVVARSWLEKGVEALLNGGVERVAGRVKIVPRGKRVSVWEYVDSCLFLKQDIYVKNGRFAATANLFVTKAAFTSVGGFRNDLQSSGDWEFGQRMSDNGFAIKYAAEALVYHPARGSVKALLNKAVRIGRGKLALKRLGIHGKRGNVIGMIVPGIPRSGEHNLRIPAWKYPAAIIGYNLVRYVNNFYRLIA